MKYTPFALICVIVLFASYALPVGLGISFTFTPDEVDLIFDTANSNHFVKNHMKKATLTVQHTLEGKCFVDSCCLFSLHRVI